MKIIKTTAKTRDYYAQHLNQMLKMADMRERGETEGILNCRNCYMCRAAEEILYARPCEGCPINLVDEEMACAVEVRELNLRTESGDPTDLYRKATPASIRKHVRWMERQIKKHTDCEIFTE